MACLVAFALLFFAGFCHGESSRVVGGDSASIEQYPSLVQVEFLNAWSNLWSQNCAGIVLNEVFILSAAHCFEGSNYKPSQRRIRAGTTYRDSGGVIAYVAGDTKHPSYGVASRWDADITVVRLASFLVFSPVIQQALIVAPDNDTPDNLPLDVVGWGHTSEGEPATELQHTSVYTINNAICRQQYEQFSNPAIVTENMICTGVQEGGRDHCQGDAGGALYYDSIVLGVISWGYRCGNPNYPGVSTSVSPFSNWILSVTSSL